MDKMNSHISSLTLTIIILLIILFNCYSIKAAEQSSNKYGTRKMMQMSGTYLPDDFKPPEYSCNGFQGQFPYMVSVRDKKNNHICGGTLITKNTVLTAAHCVDQRVSSNADLYPILNIGGIDLETPFKVYKTVETVIHPKWQSDASKGHDLAILKLNETTCVRPIKFLGLTYLHEDHDYQFLGFGRVSDSGANSAIAQGKVMKYIDKDTCNKRGYFQNTITNYEICTSGEDNLVSVCSGDDGGPLIYQPTIKEFKDALVGIASYTSSTKCTKEGATVFIKMKKYLNWIIKTVTKKSWRSY